MVIKGTDSGFVTTAPTSTPASDGGQTADDRSHAVKDTSPSDAVTITEVGWYVQSGNNEANYEVGLYAHNSSDDEPEARLFVSATNAKGTTSGWKTVTGLNWSISASTIYWIALQLDDTATATNTLYAAESGVSARFSKLNTETTLLDPWGTSDQLLSNYSLSIYAVYTTGGAVTSNIIMMGANF